MTFVTKLTFQSGDRTALDAVVDTVYTRRLEIPGSADIASEIGHSSFADSVRVEIEVDRKRPLGSRDG